MTKAADSVASTGLPPDALDRYARDGFLVCESLFSPEHCDHILALSHGLDSFRNGTLTPVMNPHRQEPRLLEPMRDPALVLIMEALLKGRVQGLQTQYFFGRSGIRGFTRHQDNFYVEAPQDGFASAWLALEDVDSSNGGLIVWPGSHKEPLLPVRPVAQATTFGQDPNANCQECDLPDGYQALNVCVPRGSVVFIHGHVIHASNNNNTTDRTRQVLLMTYVREGESYRPGFSARREAFDVYAQ